MIKNIDCLPVFWTILFAPVTPINTPTAVHIPYHSPLYTLMSPLIVYETAFAKEEFMTKKIEVEDATNGG